MLLKDEVLNSLESIGYVLINDEDHKYTISDEYGYLESNLYEADETIHEVYIWETANDLGFEDAKEQLMYNYYPETGECKDAGNQCGPLSDNQGVKSFVLNKKGNA